SSDFSHVKGEDGSVVPLIILDHPLPEVFSMIDGAQTTQGHDPGSLCLEPRKPTFVTTRLNLVQIHVLSSIEEEILACVCQTRQDQNLRLAMCEYLVSGLQ